jgi:asparagine synthase (glutamine-hydrolysing)
MCGIAGWFGPHRMEQPPREVVDRMLDRIGHRGPDGRGLAELPDGNGILGHVRLAIIDPAGGVQPVWSRDNRNVLVFNGEIYNYRELRQRLSRAGIAWRTESDTEVLLELLRLEGAESIPLLRGMYAFAYWDGERQLALLARDPTGIKPLFLREAGATLWFASEAKAFPDTTEWTPTLSADALHLLLNVRYAAGGSGLMHGVTQLAPGRLVEWRPSGMRQSSIRSPEVNVVAVEGVRSAVFDSVRAHLVADVPLATYLSGGVDSGIVSYVACKESPAPPRSFTIDAGDDPREAAHAAESARLLGMTNQAAMLAPTTPDTITWLLWHIEVPKVNSLQSAAVAQLAARHVKVCLSGLGGDELFLGYRAHRHLARAARAGAVLGALAAPVGRALADLLGDKGEFGEPWRAARMLASHADPPSMYALLRNVWDGALPREQVYGPRMLDQRLTDVHEWIRSRWPYKPSAVAGMAAFEWSNKMVDDLLWQEDRTSMAFGLEVRVPFVDQRLKLALEPLDAENARRPGSKYLLKRAFEGDLPAALLARPKSGFQLDIAHELDNLFGAVLFEWLSPERVRRHALFNPTFVERLLRLERVKANRWHFFLLLLMAQAHRWVELFETREVARPAMPTLIRDAA